MKITARMMKNIHLSAMIVWMCLLVPSLIWWKESVPWLVFMSLYANFVGHFSSWQAARGERMQEKRDEKENS